MKNKSRMFVFQMCVATILLLFCAAGFTTAANKPETAESKYKKATAAENDMIPLK